MISFGLLKTIHISAVALSGFGFAARGLGTLRIDAWVRSRTARTLPHVVDTVLLLSAFGMLWIWRLAPWALPWLRAKLIGLVLYIGLGTVALRSLRRARPPRPLVVGRSQGGRSSVLPLASWFAALLLFGYVVSVALTKNPLGVFALWPVAALRGPV